MGEPAKELFANPFEIQRRADALLRRWNELQNQALGPAAKSREDVPASIQDRILRDRKRYRKLVTRPNFADYEALGLWYQTYRRRARQLAEALPAGESLNQSARPQALPGKKDLGVALSEFGRDLAITVGVVGGVFLAFKLLTGSRRG